MRYSVLLLASAFFYALPLAAPAETIHFTLTGGDGTLSFSLPSAAVPATASTLYSTFTLPTVTYNGAPVANDTVYFYSPSDGGGLTVLNADSSFILDEFGPTLFSGTPASPTFYSGIFLLSDGSALANRVDLAANGDVLTIAVVPSVSAVPAPSAFARLGTGVLGLAGLARRLLQT